eukprot:Protomagalhaensia_sp_Gyna_25__337@NODE_1159_length_2123_cov_13_268714_g919_i0_p2_GENE_NODE_1159_length_2123_cov_13_268714_g919_i0NODE_1159_length_2123_cov_13_268714_g919_i0_p2_ORF_typecomplete_len155_score23_57_NODE_1159_length_2123_cov_13_268714_g919_i016042068
MRWWSFAFGCMAQLILVSDKKVVEPHTKKDSIQDHPPFLPSPLNLAPSAILVVDDSAPLQPGVRSHLIDSDHLLEPPRIEQQSASPSPEEGLASAEVLLAGLIYFDLAAAETPHRIHYYQELDSVIPSLNQLNSSRAKVSISCPLKESIRQFFK